MSQSKARAARRAAPKANAKPKGPPRSRSTTIDSVHNALDGLQREQERLRLMRLANSHKPSDPALDPENRLMPDDEGEYVEDQGTEDERRYLSYAQRERQIAEARDKIDAAYDRKTIEAVRVLMESRDSEVMAQVKQAQKGG